ncbi:MAG: hypothetical protein AAF231_04680 [Pseudomonadota bacterium]
MTRLGWDKSAFESVACKAGIGLLAGLSLAACSTQAPSADRLELATIWPGNVIPKSTPRELVSAFDAVCVKTNGPATQETALRNAGYVPTNTTRGDVRQVFVIDNRAPAIAISDTMCIARATARTGQSNAVARYVTDTFPSAKPMNREDFSVDIEQAWAIPGGILATARNRWVGNRSSYSLIYFQPEGTS